MDDERWRVILTAQSSRGADATIPVGRAHLASVREVAADRFPGHSPFPGYYQGSEFILAVNVSAPDATSAERAGAEILTAGLPPWITVRTVEARRLLHEPDFTSPPSPV